MRSGTLNVPGIIGLAKAINQLQTTNYKLQIKKIQNLQSKLKKGIIKIYPKVKIISSLEKTVPNNLSVIFTKIESQIMLIAFDQEGIAVSTGSACQAKGVEPSHVLLSLSYSHQEAMSFIRFSLGKYTTNMDIEYTLEKLEKIIQKLTLNKIKTATTNINIKVLIVKYFIILFVFKVLNKNLLIEHRELFLKGFL